MEKVTKRYNSNDTAIEMIKKTARELGAAKAHIEILLSLASDEITDEYRDEVNEFLAGGNTQ